MMIYIKFSLALEQLLENMSVNPFVTTQITKYFCKDNTEKELKCQDCGQLLLPTAYKVFRRPTTTCLGLYFYCADRHRRRGTSTFLMLYIRPRFNELVAYDYWDEDEVTPLFQSAAIAVPCAAKDIAGLPIPKLVKQALLYAKCYRELCEKLLDKSCFPHAFQDGIVWHRQVCEGLLSTKKKNNARRPRN